MKKGTMLIMRRRRKEMKMAIAIMKRRTEVILCNG